MFIFCFSLKMEREKTRVVTPVLYCWKFIENSYECWDQTIQILKYNLIVLNDISLWLSRYCQINKITNVLPF